MSVLNRMFVTQGRRTGNAQTRNAVLLGKVETQSLCVVVDDLALHQDQADETLVAASKALGSVGSLLGDVALLGLGGGLAVSTALVGAAVLALSLSTLRVHVTSETGTGSNTRVEKSV